MPTRTEGRESHPLRRVVSLTGSLIRQLLFVCFGEITVLSYTNRVLVIVT